MLIQYSKSRAHTNTYAHTHTHTCTQTHTYYIHTYVYHYRDSLRLFIMNKIIDCWTIQIVKFMENMMIIFIKHKTSTPCVPLL